MGGRFCSNKESKRKEFTCLIPPHRLVVHLLFPFKENLSFCLTYLEGEIFSLLKQTLGMKIAFFSPKPFSKKLGATKNRIELAESLQRLGWKTFLIESEEIKLGSQGGGRKFL